METLMSMEEMRAQLEQLEREETEIDDQQPPQHGTFHGVPCE